MPEATNTPLVRSGLPEDHKRAGLKICRRKVRSTRFQTRLECLSPGKSDLSAGWNGVLDVAGLSPPCEECLQQCCRFLLAYAAHYLRAMQTSSPREHSRPMFHTSTFRVVGTEHHLCHPKMHARRGTHCARFQTHDQCASPEPRRTQPRCGRSHRPHLGMRRGVTIRLHSIARPRQHPAVRSKHNCAHRNLSTQDGRTGLDQRGLHRGFGEVCHTRRPARDRGSGPQR